MLTMSSKPLSAGQARTYHAREFASERQNYWSRDQQGFSEWQGRLAGQWGLGGAVGSDSEMRPTHLPSFFSNTSDVFTSPYPSLR